MPIHTTTMRQSLLLIPCITALLLTASCRPGQPAAQQTRSEAIALRHAELLHLSQGKGYTVAEIKNPWDTAHVLHRYVLVPREQELPQALPQGEVVRTPIQKAVYYTSMHVSLMHELGAHASIGGVCDAQYMTLPYLQRGLKEGRIVDCGSGPAPNLERIVDLAPDAILLSPFENSGSYGKLGALGIPLIECADYMESSPLGRAEWMRFYGRLVDKGREADSLFAQVETAYKELQERVRRVEKRPTVVDGQKFGSQWYVAGARSTIGRLITDAGGTYVFDDETASGSVPYSPEQVFDRAQEADIWMLKSGQETPLTYALLAQEWANYAEMKAYKQRQVYVCPLNRVPYYEETPFHPERILTDYIRILHPEALPQHSLRYYQRLTD